MIIYLFIFLGGGLGSILRSLVYSLVSNFSLPSWAGTVLVNSVGGLLVVFLKNYFDAIPFVYQKFLKVGLLGGLTTFSTLSLDMFDLIKVGAHGEAVIAFSLNIIFGVVIGILLFK